MRVTHTPNRSRPAHEPVSFVLPMLDGLDIDGIIALTIVAALVVATAITVILVMLNK